MSARSFLTRSSPCRRPTKACPNTSSRGCAPPWRPAPNLCETPPVSERAQAGAERPGESARATFQTSSAAGRHFRFLEGQKLVFQAQLLLFDVSAPQLFGGRQKPPFVQLPQLAFKLPVGFLQRQEVRVGGAFSSTRPV